ncbi:hypothetical protein D9M70_532390 [compost metagenome]
MCRLPDGDGVDVLRADHRLDHQFLAEGHNRHQRLAGANDTTGRVHLQSHDNAVDGRSDVSAGKHVLCRAQLLLKIEKFGLHFAELGNRLVQARRGQFHDLLFNLRHRLPNSCDCGDVRGALPLELSLAPAQLKVPLARGEALLRQLFKISRLCFNGRHHLVLGLDHVFEPFDLILALQGALMQNAGFVAKSQTPRPKNFALHRNRFSGSRV